MRETLTLTAADGTPLEAEVDVPDGAPAGFVLCHPHPEHGGSMHSVVTGALFEGLSRAGLAVVRFNFRSVEGSGGTYSEGDLERLDARAALEEMAGRMGERPVVLSGWSFGADVALSVRDDLHAAWFLVAPPLKWAHGPDETGADARPKWVALGQHDRFKPPEEVEAAVASWAQTTVEVVGGADHFFLGRTDRLVALARDLAGTL